MSDQELSKIKNDNKRFILGIVITIIISISGAWGAMNARLYEVEAKIRLLEVRTSQVDKSEDAIQSIQQSLIRIEGKLDLKQDRFK
jgi:hypothetical protein